MNRYNQVRVWGVRFWYLDEERTNLLREAGFVPAQRTMLYEILKIYKRVEAA